MRFAVRAAVPLLLALLALPAPSPGETPAPETVTTAARLIEARYGAPSP